MNSKYKVGDLVELKTVCVISGVILDGRYEYYVRVGKDTIGPLLESNLSLIRFNAKDNKVQKQDLD